MTPVAHALNVYLVHDKSLVHFIDVHAPDVDLSVQPGACRNQLRYLLRIA